MNDTTAFGKEWQVLEGEPNLFHAKVGPQAPQTCAMPSSVSEARRRLAEGKLTLEEAERACSHVTDGNEHTPCVLDVMATMNLDTAGAY